MAGRSWVSQQIGKAHPIWDDIKLTLTISAILIALTLVPSNAAPAPERGVAVITVPRPVSANLMQLAGVVGRGTAIIQHPDHGTCHQMQERFEAGGFWGLDP